MNRFIPQTVIAVAALTTFAADSRAAVLYDSTNGTGYSSTAGPVRPHIPPSSGDLTGQGDDYGTVFSSITVTGLSFIASLQGSTNVTANFYNSSDNLVTSIAPAAGELIKTGSVATQTFGAGDFGPNGIVVPGNGYVVFSVTSSDGVNRGGMGLQFQTVAPIVGSNDTTNSAQLDYQGVFSTGAYVKASVFNGSGFTQVPANVAQFQLTGTPEPASLALLATPLAMALPPSAGLTAP